MAVGIPVASGLLLLLAVGAAALTVQPLDTTWHLSAVSGYGLHNNTRCSGHYRVEEVSHDEVEACREECAADAACSKFSLEIGQARGCFLYDSQAPCAAASGFVSGFKDTRCAQAADLEVAHIACPFGTVVSRVVSASYGTPQGQCQEIVEGACASKSAKGVVEDLCIGEASCDISASSVLFGDPCPGTTKALHVHVECQAGETFHEDVFFNAWSSRNWAKAQSEVETRRADWQRALAAVPPYPAASVSGRGIIIVAGGKYLQPALVMLRMLRDLGCTLRIQIWHLGDEEMTAAHRAMLEPFNVETRDFRQYATEEQLRPIAANVGMRLFQLKPLALLHSDLQEVLLLDSDNCPVRDPTYLFDDEHYTATGTVFWPDYWKTSKENPIWSIVNAEPDDSWEQESGQLLVDKSRAWTAIGLCVHFNQEFYMQLLNGDKDTFRFSWLAAAVPFYMVQVEPTPVGTLKELHSQDTQGFCSHTMLQHDPAGVALFVHHNQLKNTHLPLGENFRYKKLPGNRYSSYRTMPVAGLALPDGSHLACNDVAGEGFSLIDSDDAVVQPAGLGDFEVHYFAAANSVPHDAFEKFSSLGAPLADAALAEVRSRRNTGENVTNNCDPGLFELTAAQCELITLCGADQTETAGPTATSDRLCESNSIDFVRTFEINTDGTDYFARVENTGNFKARGRVTVSHGALYEFQLVNIPAGNPVVLERPGGVIYNDGVTNNIASGNEVIQLDTAPAAVGSVATLAYADNADVLLGGVIDLVDPTYSKSFVGNRLFFDGPYRRFNTAYNPDVRVFTESTVGVTSQAFRDLRTVCFDICSPRSDCVGLHIFATPEGTFCYGLSDVGGETATEVDSQSWTKVVTATVQNA